MSPAASAVITLLSRARRLPRTSQGKVDMGALAAILQSDGNLMRCQLARLANHVSLREGTAPPDAYGFGHYHAGNVLLSRRPSGAPSPLSLADLVGRVDSEALLVHARRATIGTGKDENTHPFRFRRWLFAHDGTIEAFDRVRPLLLAHLPDFLRRNIAGDTDSEHAFMWFLKELKDAGALDDLDAEARDVGRALARTVRRLEAWSREAGEQRPSRLCFVATNGRTMAATRRGGPLSYALLEGIVPCPIDDITDQTPESDPRLRPHRRVKAVCFASRLLAPNGFIEVPEGSVVSVSRSLQVTVSALNGPG
jgi:predicted glutamine amidotransferase